MKERTNKETHEKQKKHWKWKRNGSQNRWKIKEKSTSGAGFGAHGGTLGISEGLCRQSGAQEEVKMQPRWPKMLPKRPTWANMRAKLAPRWRYDGQLAAKKASKSDKKTIRNRILFHTGFRRRFKRVLGAKIKEKSVLKRSQNLSKSVLKTK